MPFKGLFIGAALVGVLSALMALALGFNVWSWQWWLIWFVSTAFYELGYFIDRD